MKSIHRKLIGIVILVFIPFVLTIGGAVFTFESLEDDGTAINLSGSQRMRTMFISNYSQQYAAAIKENDSSKKEKVKVLLEKEVNKYNKIMSALINGDDELNISKNKNSEIVTMLKGTIVETNQYADATKKLLSEKEINKNTEYIISNALPIKNNIHKVVEKYQENYDKKIKDFKRNIAIFLFIGIIMLAYGSRLIKKQIVKPIVDLTTRLEEIASGDGDLTQMIQVKSEDEIGKLAIHFNEFIGKIRNMVIQINQVSEVVSSMAVVLNKITNEVNEGSERLATITTEIASGATDQAGDVASMANNLMSLGEDIGNINQVSSEMEKDSIDMQKVNDQSKVSMVELSKSNMENINASNEINGAIDHLNEKAEKITIITEVINNIARQTNLLALNASIEAARAGEQGRGFAVVADEISKLAEQSNESTSEIYDLLEDVKEQINITKKLMLNVLDVSNAQSNAVGKTEENFDKITGSLESIIEKIVHVDSRVENVNSKKDDILSIIQNISSVSDEIAASTQEVAAFADEFQASVNEITTNTEHLNESADNLKELVSKFKV